MASKAMQGLMQRVSAMTFRMEGSQKEFCAAAVMQSEAEMTAMRERMHTLLDAQLDLLHEIAILSRKEMG